MCQTYHGKRGCSFFLARKLGYCIRYFPTQALNFAFKDKIKAQFKTSKDASQVEKFSKNIASGGCPGTLSLMFVYSLDFARTKLANDAKGKGGERKYKGLVDVYKQTLATDGIGGLYRGFVFGLYDSLKPILLPKDAGFFISFALGYAITVPASLGSYPIDTVRRRMMMTSGTGVHYKSSIDCGMQILKNEGFMSMMKGAGANILRGAAGAGVLAGFDSVKSAYISFRTS